MPQWYQDMRSVISLLQSVAGMLIFWYAMKRRKHSGPRLLLGLAVGGVICYLSQQALYQPDQTTIALVGRELNTLVNLGCLLGITCFLFDESIWTAIMATATGSVSNDLGGSVKEFAKTFPFVEALCHDSLGVVAVDLVCYGGLFCLLFFAFRPFTKVFRSEEEDDLKLKVIVSVVVVVVRLTLVRFMRDVPPDANTTLRAITTVYHLMSSLLLLMLQFDVMERNRLTRRVAVMDELMHEQYIQYEESQATVELIQEKYHDLKQMIATLDGTLPEGELSRLKESVEKFETRVRSGNKVLDVLLTQKMDQCIQRSIDVTIGLGQTDFGCMEEMDLYTLFQNVLNNAINAVSSLPEGSYRFITLLSRQDRNMITIHAENPCRTDIAFEDGLPKTNQDPQYHGFGMRSMERTAEKYHGTVAAKTEDGVFYLDILLTVPETA